MTSAVLKLSPVEPPAAVLPVVAPMTISEVLDLAGAPAWFNDHGVVRLVTPDGLAHVIPRQNWQRVRVKPEGVQIIELCVVPSGRNTLALLATVATVALAAAVSGGLLGPAGLGLGAAFKAGAWGATLAAAGVGLGGQLLVAALTAPPKPSDEEARRELSQAGISANGLSLLAPVPVILGTIRHSPPLLAPVYTTFHNEEVTVHAVVGVEGRCAISDIKINGVDAAEIARLEYETREGVAGEDPRTIAMLTAIEQRDGQTLSNFRTDLVSDFNDTLEDQSDPDSCVPDWVTIETDGEWDEVWLRFLFPAGIVQYTSGDKTVVPVRIEARQKGEASWRAFPTVHFYDAKGGTGPMRAEVKLMRKTQPSGPHYSHTNGEYPVIELTNITGIGQTFEYESDAYFQTTPLLGTDMLPAMTGATTSGVTISASSERAGDEAWRAADATTNYWRPAADSLPAWWKVDFGSAQTVRSYMLTVNSPASGAYVATAPRQWYWEGSNDDVTYTRLDADDVFLPLIGDVCIGQIGSPGSYRYYRLNVVVNNGAAAEDLIIYNIELYAIDAPGSAIYDDSSSYWGGLALHTSSGNPRCVYGSCTPDGAEFYLDPAQWPRDTYEIGVRRGLAFQESVMSSWPSYSWGSVLNSDFFEYRLSGASYIVRIGQKEYRSDTTLEVATTVDYAEPFDADGLALIAMRVPNMAVDSISALFSAYAPVWDGSMWAESETVTANPAAQMRKLLIGAPNPRPVPGEVIDDAELGEFYTACATAGHVCNAVIDGRSIDDTLRLIAATGYAAPRSAELWGVVRDFDRTADPVTQAITPRNSRDLGTTQALPDLPHAIRAQYFDEDDDYTLAHATIYRDGYDAGSATLFEVISYDGFTDGAKVEARAAFDLKQMTARARRYAREMGIEGFTIRRGQLVQLVDEVLDDVAVTGFIKSLTTSGSSVYAVTLESVMPFSLSDTGVGGVDDITSLTDILQTGRPLALCIRLDDGSVVQHLVREVTDSATATFAVPFSTGTVAIGQMCFLGYYGVEKRRCVVMDVEASGSETRRITLADEAPELFGAEPETVGPAHGLLVDMSAGVAIMFKYSSMVVRDNTTPANDFDGLPENGMTFSRGSVAVAWRAGVLQDLGTAEMAYDSVPATGAHRGVRIEGNGTNLCLRSEDLSNANWTKNFVTITANATTAPDGSLTADLVLNDLTTNRHSVGKNSLTVTADAVYTWSCYLKAYAGTTPIYPIVYITSGGYTAAERVGAVFDLTAGTASAITTAGTGPAGVATFIEDCGNGWYRCSLAASIGNGDTAVGFHIGMRRTPDAVAIAESYLGDGDSGFYAWGAQIEDGMRFPTSYMPADAASGTRSTDLLTLPATDFKFSETTGTVSVIARTALGNPGNQVLVQFDDGDNNDRIVIQREPDKTVHFIVTVAGVDVVDLDLGTVEDDTRFGVAASWKANDFAASLNGGAVATDVVASSLPTGITQWRFGSAATGGRLFGYIEQVRYVTPAQSNPLLIALSTL